MPLTFDTEKIARLKSLLEGKRKVLIAAHKNPDGDAVGSMLGLAWLLKKHQGLTDQELLLVLPNPCPPTYRYLPGSELIIDADTQPQAAREAFLQADLIIGVDFNTAPRLGTLQAALEQAPAPKVLMDHHHSPDLRLFSLVFSRVDLSSACELVYWVARQAWGPDCLDLPSARCLYNGLKTDTGSFAFSNEQPTLYEAAADLVRHPIGAADMHNEIFNDFSVPRLRFFAHCLSHNLRVFEPQGLAYIFVTKDDLDRFGMQDSDTEGLVNYTLKMKQMHVGVLIKETATGIRLSFRSKHEFDVNHFARQHWNGGGHTKAAGGSSTLTLAQTLQTLENQLLPLLS